MATPAEKSMHKFKLLFFPYSKSDSFNGFTYDASSTPTVTSLEPISSSPRGGIDLTINGTAFGETPGSVKLCNQACQITSWTDIQIVCIIPENQDAKCPPVIEIPGNGYAGVNNVSPFTYRFR